MPSTIGPSPPPISPRRPEGSSAKRKTKQVSRPGTLSRRQTPQYITRLGAPKTPKEPERSISVEGVESFPDYCTYCEKQIAGTGNKFLYCSESCRQRDLQTTLPSPRHSITSLNGSIVSPSHKSTIQHVPFSSSSRVPTSPPLTPFHPPYTFGLQDGPDIIPRASPTISRPRSYFNTDNFTLDTPGDSHSEAFSASIYALSNSTYAYQSVRERKRSSTALASLRELSSALELTRDNKDKDRRYSRESRSSLSSIDDQVAAAAAAAAEPTLSKSSSGVWSYMTRASRKSSKEKGLSKTYDVPSQMSMAAPSAGNRERWSGQFEAMPLVRAGGAGTGMERPLPPRTEAYRKKGIDLLMPFSG